MKLSCPKKELMNAIQIVSKAVSSKQQMPILSGIYLKASEGTLELQATNYELGIIVKIRADVDNPGQIVLSGRYLQEVIRKLPGDMVQITLNKEANIVQLKSNKSNFTLLNMNPSEFPTIQFLEGNVEFSISSSILYNLIKKTVFSCSNDDSRPVFTGCYMEVNDITVTMAATNMHRLAIKTETFPDSIGNIKIIIPSKSLNELLHIINPDIPTDVHVSCSHNKISFSFDNIYMTSRLIEGAFPNYQSVIPKESATVVHINTEEFSAAVDRVSLISRSNEYNVIRLAFSKGQIHISSNNPEIGNAEETVSASVEGPDVNIAFNATYITDVLKNIDTEECIFYLNKSLNPLSIREKDNDTFLYVATPVRTAH